MSCSLYWLSCFLNVNLHQVKVALKLFAAGERVAAYNRNANVDARTVGRAVVAELNKGDALEGEFWFELSFFVQLMTPVYELLLMADGTVPCMSKFFNGMLKMPEGWDEVCKDQATASNDMEGEGWKDESVLERLGEMKEKNVKRRKYVHSPMLSTAYALDPEYIGRNITEIDDGQILLDMHTMYERLLIDHGDDSPAGSHQSRERRARQGTGGEGSKPVQPLQDQEVEGPRVLVVRPEHVPRRLVGDVRTYRPAGFSQSSHPHDFKGSCIGRIGTQLESVRGCHGQKALTDGPRACQEVGVCEG